MLQLVAAVFLVIVTAELGGSSVITAPSIRRRQSGCVGNLKSFQVGVTLTISRAYFVVISLVSGNISKIKSCKWE